MVTLNQLEVLVSVVESGGFSGAAKALYMSQPSVSNHVRNLENSLGVQLVERTPPHARATPAGEVVVEHARRVFELLASLEHSVARFQGLDAGRLVVAGTTTVGTFLLPMLVADFAARAPNVDCQIRVGNEETVEDWVVRGDVALGLCIDRPRELDAEPLFEEEMRLVCAPGSELAGRTVRPESLDGRRFLMREKGSATRRQQEEALLAWGLPHAPRWELWGPATLKEAAAEGLGIVLLPEQVTARERAAGLLAEITVDPPPPSRTVSLVRRPDRTLTPPEEAFAALLRTVESWQARAPGRAQGRAGTAGVPEVNS